MPDSAPPMVPMNVRMSEEDCKRLKALAAARGTTLSDEVRQAVKVHLLFHEPLTIQTTTVKM